MVAALVLSLVGVPDDVIVHDYTLTDDRMVFVMERIRTSGDFPEPVTPMLERVGRAEAASMETFLAAVRDTHGDAAGWARDAGLSDATVARLHAVLVTALPRGRGDRTRGELRQPPLRSVSRRSHPLGGLVS